MLGWHCSFKTLPETSFTKGDYLNQYRYLGMDYYFIRINQCDVFNHHCPYFDGILIKPLLNFGMMDNNILYIKLWM